MKQANSKKSFANLNGTMGFIGIEDFKGQTTTIDLDNLKNFIDFLKLLSKMGFNEVKLGIETNSPLLMFLDKENKTAFAIAPIIEDG